MTVIEWSAAIAAAAFVLLVAGVLIGLRAAMAKLAGMQASAEAMQREVQRLAKDYGRLVQPAEQTIRTAQNQLQAASGLFNAASQIGGAMEQSASAVRRVSSVLSDQAAQHVERAAEKRQIGEAFEWMELGMAAWQLWQSRRKKAADGGDPPEWVRMDKGHHKVERSE